MDLAIQHTHKRARRFRGRAGQADRLQHESKSVSKLARQKERERGGEEGGGEEVSVGGGELRMHPEANPLVSRQPARENPRAESMALPGLDF